MSAITSVKNHFVAELPDELLFNVFSHLDVGSLGLSTGVCRAWSRVGSDDKLWKPMFPGLETAEGKAKATLSMLAVGSEASLLNRVSAFATGARYGEEKGFVCLYPHDKCFAVVYIHPAGTDEQRDTEGPVNLSRMRVLFRDPMELALFQTSMRLRHWMIGRDTLIEGTRLFVSRERMLILTVGVGSFGQDVESNRMSVELHNKIVRTAEKCVKDDDEIVLPKIMTLISVVGIYFLVLRDIS